LQIKTNIVSSHTADSKPVKQEVNGTVTLPPLVFPGITIRNVTLSITELEIQLSVIIPSVLSVVTLNVAMLSVISPCIPE
jgi:hypothetical protein